MENNKINDGTLNQSNQSVKTLQSSEENKMKADRTRGAGESSPKRKTYYENEDVSSKKDKNHDSRTEDVTIEFGGKKSPTSTSPLDSTPDYCDDDSYFYASWWEADGYLDDGWRRMSRRRETQLFHDEQIWKMKYQF